MAKLQRDDAKMLWEEMGEDRSWGSLEKVLQGHLEKSRGIEDCTVQALLGEAKQFKKSKDDFPGSRTAMMQMLNKNIEEFRKDCDEKSKSAGKRQQRETRSAEKKTGQERRGESAGRSTAVKAVEPSYREQQRSSQGMNKSAQQKMTSPQKSDREMATAYQPAHIEMLYTRGNWKSWDEIIRWLEQHGHADGAFNDLEVKHMIRDLQILRDSGAPFTPNHEQVFELIHNRRG